MMPIATLKIGGFA